MKDRVILYKNGLKITMRPGTDLILVNSNVYQLPGVIRKANGNILIPKQIKKIINQTKEIPLSIKNPVNKKFNFQSPKKKPGFINNSSKKVIVILDAGHGGKDPGCINKKYKIYEKDIVIKVVKYTKMYLKKYAPDIDIVLTRKSDVYLSLETRADIANKNVNSNVNGIFISFHVNYSIFNKRSSGLETFFYSPLSYANAKEKEILGYRLKHISRIYYSNGFSRKNVEVASSMLELQLSRKSEALASILQKRMLKGLPFKTVSRGIKRDRFFVLAHTVMPSVLLELGFLSNNREALRLKKRRYQIYLAKGIAKGIKQYINLYHRD
jgi:N-acetylmuramoyl-L-alanine amidase